MHSEKFEVVKNWYDNGHWTERMVADAVVKGWITPEEFEEITRQPYEVTE